MAVADDVELFKQWDDASGKAALRRLMFERVKEKYPENHILYRHAKSELEKAEAHLDAVQSKL